MILGFANTTLCPIVTINVDHSVKPNINLVLWMGILDILVHYFLTIGLLLGVIPPPEQDKF